MGFIRKHSFKIAVLVLLLAVGAYLFYSLVWSKGQPLPIEMDAPEFTIQDIDGKEVSLADTAGKVKLVYFYFANCPDVCPPTTFLLSQLQDLLREDKSLVEKAELISITFDPVRDTPEEIRNFATRNHAQFDGWHFLRGEEEATRKLAESYKIVVTKNKETGEFGHYNRIILVDKDNQIRKWFNGSDEMLSAEDMFKEMKRLF
ncbi:SCO family protein [Paenibacillus yanchengensis]|uniref:SCO family protein n=1 Tax=Paenibacillus yanchengensis TaxID=2035833 RepID=A0ABW4YPX7_9BACL